VGKAGDVLRYQGPKTRVIARPEAFALPGLIDAHVHLAELGAVREQIDLRGVDNLDNVAWRIRARIEAQPGDAWITGRNWDQSLGRGGAFPMAAVLDAVAPHCPVWLRRVDGHAGWANSEARRRAQITPETKAPPDGQFRRDAEGRPTGVFIDGAMGLVGRVIPA
jgi:predicted amidohydrolase YtcJ